MKSKLFAVMISILGGGLLFVAKDIHAPFSYDPLGPRAIPVVISLGLLVLPLLIILSPRYRYENFTIDKKAIKLCIALCFYFISFEILGFMLSTTISSYFIARIIGSSRMQGIITGLVISIVFYGVFRLLLNAPLPLGEIYEFLG